jgi:hypothetical protein
MSSDYLIVLCVSLSTCYTFILSCCPRWRMGWFRFCGQIFVGTTRGLFAQSDLQWSARVGSEFHVRRESARGVCLYRLV